MRKLRGIIEKERAVLVAADEIQTRRMDKRHDFGSGDAQSFPVKYEIDGDKNEWGD